jgi:hypothetical protein
MRPSKILSFLLILGFCCTFGVSAKDAGDLLQQYLKGQASLQKEVLAYAEIVNVKPDKDPKKGWKETGWVTLRIIEVAQKVPLPQNIAVRYLKEQTPGEDAWTWRQVVLKKKARVLVFLHNWDGSAWDVRRDGRTNVINNVENIPKQLLKAAQSRFTTILSPSVAKPEG